MKNTLKNYIKNFSKILPYEKNLKNHSKNFSKNVLYEKF